MNSNQVTCPWTGRMLALVVGMLTACVQREGVRAAAEGKAALEEEVAPLRVSNGVLVAHALGSIAGVSYTNSLEAFECNYKRGYRWFEVDLALTADDELVCFHGGHESRLGLAQPIDRMSATELVGKTYDGQYPLRLFSELLARADSLGDVVLVTDTKNWSPRMLAAVKRAVSAPVAGRHSTRLVLQTYGRQDIVAVSDLSREVHAGLILTLYMTDAPDAEVEQLAKQYGALAVVANARRFSPWLAQRLDALDVPVLVHTVNDHREIMRLAQAGADGFYTDDYRPYDGAEHDQQPIECVGRARWSEEERVWVERDVARNSDYKLAPCATRGRDGVNLSQCPAGIAITSYPMAVPADRRFQLDLDVAAGSEPSSLWVEIVSKNGQMPVRRKEQITLAASERRSVTLELTLPSGSAAVQTRLGLVTQGDLVVHELKLLHGPSADRPTDGSQVPPTASN